MKIVIRIFNVIIMALSAAAVVMLFALPSFTFKSKISLDVKALANFVPSTEYTGDINIVNSLGTDKIDIGLSLELRTTDLNRAIGGDRDKINDILIEENLDRTLDDLHTPVDLITDFSIRQIITSTIKNEISTQIENARTEFGSASTAQDIMDDVGMDDEYFINFGNSLYNAANADDATVHTASNVLHDQIFEALTKAESTGLVDGSTFNEEQEAGVTDNLIQVLKDLKLVEEDGKLHKISEISYQYLAEYLKGRLVEMGVEATSLNKKSDEKMADYSDRMVMTYVCTIIPDAFYQIVGYVCLALLIGIFLFAFIWGFLFVWTLIRTFTKKPWTLFGPWFFIIGTLQLVLGLVLSIVSISIPQLLNIPLENVPIHGFIAVIRTYALVPSILFLISIVLAIVYAVLKSIAKSQYRDQMNAEKKAQPAMATAGASQAARPTQNSYYSSSRPQSRPMSTQNQVNRRPMNSSSSMNKPSNGQNRPIKK